VSKDLIASALTPDDVGQLMAIVGLTTPARLTSVAHRVQPPEGSPLYMAGGESIWTALGFEAADGTPLPGAWLHPTNQLVRVYEPGDLVHGPPAPRGHPVPEATTDALVDFVEKLRIRAIAELDGGSVIWHGEDLALLTFDELWTWWDGLIPRLRGGWRP
jgi:hypothetical protein